MLITTEWHKKNKATFFSAYIYKLPKTICMICVNPLMGTLKPQSNEPLYSNTVNGTLAVDGWAVTFARRGPSGLRPHPIPSSLYQNNSPPINGQCTNFMLFDLAL